MKQLFLVLVSSIALSSTTWANQITIDNQQAQYKTQTTAEVTHTEYRDEEQQTTCSRQVYVGSHEECHQVPGDQVCNTIDGGQECYTVGGGEQCDTVGGGQQCHTVGGGQSCGLTPSGQQCFDLPSHEECEYVPGQQQCYYVPGRQECRDLPDTYDCYNTPGHQECREVPEYKTEYYSCTQTVSVPYTVKDAEIQNDVTVQVELSQNLPKGIREVIDLDQSATALNIRSIKSTAKVLVYATQQTKVVSDNGFLKKLKTVVNIKMLDRAVVLGALSTPMSEITADANGLQVTTGFIFDRSLVRFDLNMTRKKFLGKPEVIIGRTLAADEVILTQSGNQTVARMDFAKLGILDQVAGKKVNITLTMQANATVENLVNRQDMPTDLTQKKELETKIK